ncbi:hypothetical protein JOQ06_012388, partial [Pogonophryne albipinna]
MQHPDSWKPISNHSVREGVQRSVLRPAPTHCQGPACFIGQLYGIHYAHLTATVILSDGLG